MRHDKIREDVTSLGSPAGGMCGSQHGEGRGNRVLEFGPTAVSFTAQMASLTITFPPPATHCDIAAFAVAATADRLLAGMPTVPHSSSPRN